MSEASRELGCREDQVVDLRPMLEKYETKATKEFLENLEKTSIMEMSFNNGEVITVEVLGENEESTLKDLKYDVVILSIDGVLSGSEYHKVGKERWVRTYDLKPIGYYENNYIVLNKKNMPMLRAKNWNFYFHSRKINKQTAIKWMNLSMTGIKAKFKG